jgi:hypothetical protein
MDDEGEEELLCAAAFGDLHKVQRLLREGKASITAIDSMGMSTLLVAAKHQRLAIMQRLLTDGGAMFSERSHRGTLALVYWAMNDGIPCCQWLLEFGGASVSETDIDGRSFRSHLFLLRRVATNDVTEDFTADVSLLRVAVCQGDPRPTHMVRLRNLPRVIVTVLQEGSRLREQLPAYFAEGPWRALPANGATPGPGEHLREAHHHRRALGYGAWSSPMRH